MRIVIVSWVPSMSDVRHSGRERATTEDVSLLSMRTFMHLVVHRNHEVFQGDEHPRLSAGPYATSNARTVITRVTVRSMGNDMPPASDSGMAHPLVAAVKAVDIATSGFSWRS